MTSGLPVSGTEATEGILNEAASALRRGLVVAIPTDTVYGLAVDPSFVGACDRLFEIKHRPSVTAIAVLAADSDQVKALVAPGAWSDSAEKLSQKFWPGPLTMVLQRDPGLTWDLGGSGTTVGVRIPASEDVKSLCKAIGPLAVTSANIHGAEPAKNDAEVRAMFRIGIEVIVEGSCDDVEPSTVVDLTGDTPGCFRDGAIPWSDIVNALRGAPE